MRSARINGLDGLKGLAILAVLGYHLFGHWLPGGFVGIEVFFTISGFLTARSMLQRLDGSGKLGLKHYVVHRLRRIVPPVWFMITFVVGLAWLVEAGDALVGIKDRLIAAASFTYNWYDILTGVNYFSAGGPELFKHLWFVSLLVQFYVIAPLIVMFFWKFWSPKRAVVGILVLSVASALAMGFVYVPGTDPTRAYFGTDTHMFGLLVGVALAFMLRSGVGTVEKKDTRGASVGVAFVALLGACALAAIAYGTIVVIRQDATAFRGGLFAVALLTALVIVGCVGDGSWLGILLNFKPLAGLGRFSFGVYLWHWPLATLLLFLVPPWRDPTLPWAGIVTLALTALTTWASYVCFERPVRTNGFFRSLVPEGGRRGAITWALGLILVILSVAGCVRGVQLAPQTSEVQQLLETNSSRRPTIAPPRRRAASDALKEAPPAPVRLMPTGDQMTAIGDSVMLAAQPSMQQTFPGISLDAAVSRSMPAGIGEVSQLEAQHNLREYVVVSLATNSQVSDTQLDQLLAACGPGKILVLVNAHGNRSWIPPTNQALADYAKRHSDRVILVNWDAAAHSDEASLYSDGIHPKPGQGADLYASTIRSAIADWVKTH